MRVEQLYRYPVKGLSAEPLARITLAAGEVFPQNRAFALAHGDAPFDPTNPVHLPKHNFMCLMKNERAAALRSSFDPATGALVLRAPDGSVCDAPVLTAGGCERIATFLAAYLGVELRGRPVLHHVPGHAFIDVQNRYVSLISLGTLAAFERDVAAVRHKLRFRANIHVSGGEPWAEFGWLGPSPGRRRGSAIGSTGRRTVHRHEDGSRHGDRRLRGQKALRALSASRRRNTSGAA